MMCSDPTARKTLAWGLMSAGLLFVVAAGAARADESGVAGEADVDPDTDYLSPDQLYKAAEGSDRNYSIASADDLADVHVSEFARIFWPTTGKARRYPWVETDPDGERVVRDYDLGPACRVAVGEADRACAAGRYDEASDIYEQAAKDDSRCYIAYSRYADCRVAQADDEGALGVFGTAIQLNPFDFRVHFEMANALFRLGRFEESRASYAQALALSPHDPSVIRVLRTQADALGIELVDRPFAPRAIARDFGPEVAIFVDGDDPYWTVYGLCKGLWIGEPALRQSRTGSMKHSWSLIEERQCLLSMFENYVSLTEGEMIEKDPDLERIFEAIETSTLDGFVLYEIAYRVNPHITLRFPLETLDEVVEYVKLHVLVKDATESPTPTGSAR